MPTLRTTSEMEADSYFTVSDTDVQTSVIIPAYNEERLIASMLQQFSPEFRTEHHVEVILSDGGSVDETVEIAAPLADRCIQYHGSERQTISAGRNAGAAEANGSVLIFLNADVRLPDDLSGFLSALRSAAAETGAATCRVRVHPEKATLRDTVILGTMNGYFWLLNRIGIGMGRGECHAVTRDLFNTVRGYREDLVAGEDFDLFHRLAEQIRRDSGKKIAYLWEWSVFEDPRRYRKIGYTRTLLQWFANAVSIMVRGKSVSQEWTPFR